MLIEPAICANRGGEARRTTGRTHRGTGTRRDSRAHTRSSDITACSRSNNPSVQSLLLYYSPGSGASHGLSAPSTVSASQPSGLTGGTAVACKSRRRRRRPLATCRRTPLRKNCGRARTGPSHRRTPMPCAASSWTTSSPRTRRLSTRTSSPTQHTCTSARLYRTRPAHSFALPGYPRVPCENE